MQLKGKLIEVLPLQTGKSQNGEWKKQDIIIETDDQYPKKICVCIWGDKINEGQLQVGNQLLLSINLESRAYNNRWYTDVKAWKIEVEGSQTAPPPVVSEDMPDFLKEDEEDDILPF